MIEVNNITKIYDGQRALDNVSFSIKEGEVVGLLGPNGAGKSTLMKILTCYIPPTEGEATVCGHSIYEDPLSVRREIGYLPEHNPLYLDMYVREFLDFSAGIYGLKNRHDRVEEMIELVGLTPESNKRIGQLSKGYRHQVRCHLSWLGFPIEGDPLYSSDEKEVPSQDFKFWASKIQFPLKTASGIIQKIFEYEPKNAQEL